jgi:hypothetical protein
MIKIVDVFGRVVIDERETEVLSLAYLSAGIYTVCLYKSDGTLYQREKITKL